MSLVPRPPAPSHIRAYVTCPRRRRAGCLSTSLRPAARSAALPPRRLGVVRRQRLRRERVDRRLHGLLGQVRDVGRRRCFALSRLQHVVPRVDGVELDAHRRRVPRRALPGPEAVPARSDEIRDPRTTGKLSRGPRRRRRGDRVTSKVNIDSESPTGRAPRCRRSATAGPRRAGTSRVLKAGTSSDLSG